MSGELLQRAWRVGGLKPSEKLALLFAADIARDEHGRQMWCKSALIAAATGLSQQSVKDALRSLVAAGHLSRVVRPGTTTKFTVHPRPTEGEIYPRSEIYPGEILPPGEGKFQVGGEGKISPGEGVQTTPLTTIEPSIEPAREPTQRASAGDWSPPDWIPTDPWNGFVEMRRRSRAPLTPRAMELSVRELNKLRDAGHEPGAVLDQSTSRGWKGLFPLKETNSGSQSRAPGHEAGRSIPSQNGILQAIAERRQARSV